MLNWLEPGEEVAPAWLLVGLVVGHAALALTFLSRLHGLGLKPRLMNRIDGAPLVVPAVVALGFVWLILRRRFDAWPTLARDYAYACAGIAYLILPAVVLSRRLRRSPTGVVGRSEPVALETPAEGPSAWIGGGKHAWMLNLPGNEALSLRVADWEIPHPSLPPRFGPLRILHLTDLHFARCYARGYFEAIADAVAGWPADLVLFTGDLVDDEAALDWTVPVLGRLRGRLGQFAILGNHDVLHRPGRVRRALRSAGFSVIDGRWTLVEDDGRSIALGGTSHPWGPSLDPSTRPEADATIVLSHGPDTFPAVARWGTVDLLLAGHNHGGQVRLPVVGPLVMPSVFGCHYDRGVFRRGRTVMELCQGIGGKHPLRYGCTPEVARLVLRPAASLPAKAPSRSALRGNPASRA